jgi:hypothetical protein
MRVWSGLVWVTIVVGAMACGAVALGQEGAETKTTTVVVRGRVLNKVTGEGIGRALVTTAGDQYAVMTDDRGQFEMNIVENGQAQAGFASRTTGPGRTILLSTVAGQAFLARKPGYLETGYLRHSLKPTEESSEVTFYLLPEALIVGRVNVPGTEGEVRIQCELYRKMWSGGRETWQPAGQFTTWANGEFRFSELPAGTYKLITHEQMDRDSLAGRAGAELTGYPPIYYPNTTDFTLATPIAVKAGETAQANLTVARRNYYPVKIPVRNAQASQGVSVVVHPMGHWGPGWSLGFNPMEQTIEGMLPDGNYTVEVEAFGDPGSTGMGNFAVNGAALQGAGLNMVPNASVTVNVREEFQNGDTTLYGGGVATNPQGEQERRINAEIMLMPSEESSGGRHGQPSAAQSKEGEAAKIANVRPGQYRLVVHAYAGYVSRAESGGVDLLKHPLVVGMGGEVPPIDVTLRDDGGEVSGSVEETSGIPVNATLGNYPTRFVYLIPIEGTPGQTQVMGSGEQGAFRMAQQVAPGTYLVVAYENGANEELPGSEEKMKRLEGKGQVIHVEAGEKVSNVRVKVIAEDEE